MRRLGIIVDRSHERTQEHAQKSLRAQEIAQLDVRNAREITPLGVAVHMAKYPSVCDECEDTYWTADPYSSHPGCKGPKKKYAGFTA